MRIALRPHDPRWRERFEQEAARIRRLARELPLEVEHVGSTAVPGLLAKPIVDVLVGVEQAADLDRVTAALAGAHGYVYMQAYERYVPQRRYFVVLTDATAPGRTVSELEWNEEIALDARACQIHVVRREDGLWRELLRFRELLRTDPSARRRYAALKRRLARQDWPNSRAYALHKDELIAELMATPRRAAAPNEPERSRLP